MEPWTPIYVFSCIVFVLNAMAASYLGWHFVHMMWKRHQ